MHQNVQVDFNILIVSIIYHIINSDEVRKRRMIISQRNTTAMSSDYNIQQSDTQIFTSLAEWLLLNVILSTL